MTPEEVRVLAEEVPDLGDAAVDIRLVAVALRGDDVEGADAGVAAVADEDHRVVVEVEQVPARILEERVRDGALGPHDDEVDPVLVEERLPARLGAGDPEVIVEDLPW